MDDFREQEMPSELAEVVRRLQNERPALSGLELDQIKLSVQRRAARPANGFLEKQRRTLMKSRMAITSMLIAGILAGGTGTGLAISGISSDGSAGTAQYPTEQQGQQRGSAEGLGVLGRQEAEGPGVLGRQEASDPDPDFAGAQETDDGQRASGVQASRQVGAQEDGRLAFTGLAAIPLILMGIGLLATGAVLRWRLPQGD